MGFGGHSDRHQGGERVLQRQRIAEHADAFTIVESLGSDDHRMFEYRVRCPDVRLVRVFAGERVHSDGRRRVTLNSGGRAAAMGRQLDLVFDGLRIRLPIGAAIGAEGGGRPLASPELFAASTCYLAG